MNRVVIVEIRVVLGQCDNKCEHFKTTAYGGKPYCKKKDKWITGTTFEDWCPLEETECEVN